MRTKKTQKGCWNCCCCCWLLQVCVAVVIVAAAVSGFCCPNCRCFICGGGGGPQRGVKTVFASDTQGSAEAKRGKKLSPLHRIRQLIWQPHLIPFHTIYTLLSLEVEGTSHMDQQMASHVPITHAVTTTPGGWWVGYIKGFSTLEVRTPTYGSALSLYEHTVPHELLLSNFA